MKTRSPLWWLGYCAFLLALGTAYVVMVKGAEAHDKDPPPRIQTVVEHDRDNHSGVAALLGAGVTYWIVCHRDNYHPGPKTHKACPKKK